MSKQVRWQVPFVSRLGTAYRVDIYDEGYSGTPVQLLGGPSPFTTDEDDSDDYFAPIRVQTGTLTVCTHDENGNVLITLDDILPANNIARPVQLVNVGTDTVEWQGFLSCEAYDQDYTSIPQHLQLPVISVLEAMASVEVDQTRSTGVQTINKVLYNALHEIEIQTGLTLWANIHYPYRGAGIFTKWLDQSSFYSLRESGGYQQKLTTIDAPSTKEVMGYVCEFMGWMIRERGQDIYLCNSDQEADEFCLQTLSAFNSGTTTYTGESVTEYDEDQLEWVGTNHRRTVTQGAKSVSLSSQIKGYELEITLPECPRQSLVANPQARWDKWGEFHANSIRDYYTRIDFQSVRMTCYASSDHNDGVDVSFAIMPSLQYARTMPWVNVPWYVDMEGIAPTDGTKAGTYTDYATAFLNIEIGDTDEYEEGLMVIGEPMQLYNGFRSTSSRAVNMDDVTPSDYIYRQRSVLNFYAKDGKIIFKVTARGILSFYSGYTENRWAQVVNPQLLVAIQWGSKWAYIDRSGTVTKYLWGTGFHSFYLTFDEEGEAELSFPVLSANNGEVEVYIFPVTDGRIPGTFSPSGRGLDDTVTGFMLSELSLSYEPETSQLLSSDGSNDYFRMLKTHFRDEISKTLQIASDLSNNMSPSLIMENSTTPASTITIDGVKIRPEVDLLNRLATYYGAARQRLDLIAEHPTAAPLPLLRLNGISPDNRTYAPLAESRDWQQDISTLKLFETI